MNNVKEDFQRLISKMSKLGIFDLEKYEERLAFAFMMHETYLADKEYYQGLIERSNNAIDGWLGLGPCDDAAMLTYCGCCIIVVWLDKLNEFPSLLNNRYEDALSIKMKLDNIAQDLTDTAIDNEIKEAVTFGVVPKDYAPNWFNET